MGYPDTLSKGQQLRGPLYQIAVTAHAHRIQLPRLSPDGRFQASHFRLPHGGLLGTVSELR